MKLLIVSAHYPPFVGGIPRFSQGLFRALKDQGQDVRLLTHQAATAEEPNDGIVRCAAYMPVSGRFPIPKNIIETARTLVREMNGERGAVLIQARFYPLSLLAAAVARFRRWDVVVLEHGAHHLSFGNRLDPLVALWEHLCAWTLRALGARFRGVSTAASEWLRHFGIESEGVTPNAIENRDEPEESRDKTILFVGRDIPHKGLDLLLDAYESFSRTYPGWRLRVLGVSPKAGDRLREDISMEGPVDSPTVAAALRTCAMLVLPSRFPEGLPTVILEAGLAAAPVVATAMGGVTDVLTDGENGILVQAATSDALRAGMVRMSDPLLARRLGIALRETVRARFTWPPVASALSEALRTGRGKHRPGSTPHRSG